MTKEIKSKPVDAIPLEPAAATEDQQEDRGIADNEAPSCEWVDDNNDGYDTSCGHGIYYYMGSGDPQAEGGKFCCYCGLPLRFTSKPYAPVVIPKDTERRDLKLRFPLTAL